VPISHMLYLAFSYMYLPYPTRSDTLEAKVPRIVERMHGACRKLSSANL
jgi:hypothetical protein